jgi:hypothetical protein
MAERGTFEMSRKERETLVIMERVSRKEMKLAEGAEVMGITYRQSRRRYRRYREGGAEGLVHRSRGAVSKRGLSEEVRKKILELYGGRYEGFGPVLFTEKLESGHQDRLVKELRLEQISRVTEANELLQGGFDQDLNRRFAVEPREKADYHRDASVYDLPSIFCIEEERKLSANWTLNFETSVYQIKAASSNYSPAKTQAQVRRYLDGRLHMFYRGNEVEFDELDPGKKEKKKRFIKGRNTMPSGEGKRSSPSADHPRRKQLHPSRQQPRNP